MEKLNLEKYRIKKQELKLQEQKFRSLCVACLQPGFSCYCAEIQSFDPGIEFVILIHPIEMKRRIATGRMTHLCLQNSHLIMGQDYTYQTEVNTIINNPQNQCMVLYPGRNSVNITPYTMEQKKQLLDPRKKLVVFVIDGTWATARKMMKSKNLAELPRICFTPNKASTFRVRKQPEAHCVSTIEAVHHTIELMGPACGFPLQLNQHQNLIHVFDYMVERQLDFIKQSELQNGGLSYRRERGRRSA